MTDRLPLPEPVYTLSFPDDDELAFSARQMHAYSDADNAALRTDIHMHLIELAALRERVKVLEHELSEILEWAVKERAPLRNQEIASIRRTLEVSRG